jgi:hypothetical protein
MGWLRALGRRFGIGERRWLPNSEERDLHRHDVRRRLLDAARAQDEPPTADGAPRPAGDQEPESTRVIDITPEPEGGEGGAR